MAFTIYTVSDPATIGSVMTSMAMFFGQESWVGTLIKTGLIISLLLILGKGVVANGGLRIDIILVQLVVVWVAFMPKTTVTIEHFENAAPARVVDDVPFAIAVPGAMAGSFALYMTQKIEAVMSSIQPNYMSVSGEVGMFTPAKTLMNIVTCAHDPARCVDENFLQTMYAASRYCGGGEMSNQDFHRTPNVFKSFAEGLTENNQTIKYTGTAPYNPGGGGGEAITCAEARSYIEAVGSDLEGDEPSVFAKTLDGIAKSNEERRFTQYANNQPSTRDWKDTLGIINRVTSQSANFNTLAVANVMSFAIAEQLAKTSKSNIDMTVEIKRDAGLFDWAKAESESSLMVTTTSPKFMDILFFIFIAATPIVMFIAMANPESGIKVVGAYVLFGLWTQSWIPMMAIITGWYQNEMHNYPLPGAQGFSPEYMGGYLRHIYTSTIVASNMLQASPYMMFAIMSGSMFALSNMIAKAAPSGGAGGAAEGGAAGGSGSKPSAGIPNAAGGLAAGPSDASQLASVMGGQAGLTGGLGSNAFAGGSNVAPAMGGTLPTISNSGGSQVATAAADTKAAEATQSASQTAEKGWQQVFSTGRTGSTAVSSSAVASAMRSEGYTVANSASDTQRDSTGQGTTFRVGQDTSQSSRVGLSGSASVDLGGVMAAIGGALEKSAGGLSKATGKAAEKGSLANLQSLYGQAEKALSAGDTAKGNSLLDQFGKAAASHDANFGGGASSILGQVGGIMGKALKLQAGVDGSVARGNTQTAGLSSDQSGSTDRSVASSRQVTSQSGATNTSGVQASRSASLTKAASDVESATNAAKESFQTAQSAREAQSLTRSATSSAGANSNSSIDGAALVAAWGNTQMATNGRDSGTSRQAMDRVVAALGSALGSFGGEFQQGLADNVSRLRNEGKGATMSNDQIAGAAAVQALHSMMQSGNQTTAATGFAAIASMAEKSGMGGAVNADALVRAANLVGEVDGKLQSNAVTLTPQAEAAANKVDAGMANAGAVETNARTFNADAESSAAAGFGSASGAFGSAQATGQALSQDVLAARADIQQARNPYGYEAAHDRAVGNTSFAPMSGDASTFVAGDYNATVAKEAAAALGGAYQKAEQAVEASIAHGQQTASSVAVPISNSLSAGEQVVSSVNSQVGGAASAGASTGSDVSAALPTLGGGAGIQLGGTSGGGSQVIPPQGSQQTSSKPNSKLPQTEGKGSPPIQGR